MPILVKCRCGERFNVIEEYAGTKVRCEVCQALCVVPEYRETVIEGDRYGVEKTKKCPTCKKEWPEETVLCTRCGHDFRTGKRRETTYEVVTRRWTSPPNWFGLTLHLTFLRDRKGFCTLIVGRKWFGMIPLGTRRLYLEDYDTVLVDCALGEEVGDNPIPDAYYLYMEDRHKHQVRIYHCMDEWRMREVVDTLQDLGRVKVKRR